MNWDEFFKFLMFEITKEALHSHAFVLVDADAGFRVDILHYLTEHQVDQQRILYPFSWCEHLKHHHSREGMTKYNRQLGTLIAFRFLL